METTMSNHQGGHLLNEALRQLDQQGILRTEPRATFQHALIELVRLARREYDCNTNEILEGFGERFGLCESCATIADDLVEGMCPACR